MGSSQFEHQAAEHVYSIHEQYTDPNSLYSTHIKSTTERNTHIGLYEINIANKLDERARARST